MLEALLGIVLLVQIGMIWLLLRPKEEGFRAMSQGLGEQIRDEFERNRREMTDSARRDRGELDNKLDTIGTSVNRSLDEYRREFTTQFKNQGETAERRLGELRDTVDKRLEGLQKGNEEKLDTVRETVSRSLADYREEFAAQFKNQGETVDRQMAQMRETIEKRLELMQKGNEEKLEVMRHTVDEKLQSTLEKRLGESFSLVSERLEQVHKGLGEMQALASGVGDLKRVLSSVKDRGIFGEVQLGNLLGQMLASAQYKENAAVNPDQPGQRVEYAIRLPSKDRQGETILLPIDAKFPLEDFRRLVEAQAVSNAAAADEAAKGLIRRVLQEAEKISEKYICPPNTTDYAFMYLPTEGLYAEVASRPELMERLRQYRVVPAGPTNLYALLDTVGMIYRFVAVQERAAEVWQLLGEVKSEFGKFADVMTNVKRKIVAASDEFDKVEVRTRAINRKLKQVQELPAEKTAEIFALETTGE